REAAAGDRQPLRQRPPRRPLLRLSRIRRPQRRSCRTDRRGGQLLAPHPAGDLLPRPPPRPPPAGGQPPPERPADPPPPPRHQPPDPAQARARPEVRKRQGAERQGRRLRLTQVLRAAEVAGSCHFARHTSQTTHYGAIMEAMRQSWTDDRLDDLRDDLNEFRA